MKVKILLPILLLFATVTMIVSAQSLQVSNIDGSSSDSSEVEMINSVDWKEWITGLMGGDLKVQSTIDNNFQAIEHDSNVQPVTKLAVLNFIQNQRDIVRAIDQDFLSVSLHRDSGLRLLLESIEHLSSIIHKDDGDDEHNFLESMDLMDLSLESFQSCLLHAKEVEEKFKTLSTSVAEGLQGQKTKEIEDNKQYPVLKWVKAAISGQEDHALITKMMEDTSNTLHEQVKFLHSMVLQFKNWSTDVKSSRERTEMATNESNRNNRVFVARKAIESFKQLKDTMTQALTAGQHDNGAHAAIHST